jgi:uncharacterized membrane protein
MNSVATTASASAASTAKPTAIAVPRIASIDLMRGIVMIIMAIDHVRDFLSPFPWDPTDLSKASVGLFLTRWITHYCAPTFVFLAGSSAFLYARNTGASRGALQRFLVSRGLWLVLLELTFISFGWRFDFNGLVLQVIWAIGWSMVALAGLLYLPLPGIVGVGLVMLFGHNLLDGIHSKDFADPAAAWGWDLFHELHFGTLASGYQVLVLYPLVPWIGVMALGYGFGQVLLLPQNQRDRWMLRLGLAALALFLVLRLSQVYGDPSPWAVNPRGPVYTVLSVLNVTKYPPSLLYLLMTLGTVLLLLPLLERWKGAWAQRISVFGRVPFFYYLIHLPLVHLIGVLYMKSVSSLAVIGPPNTPPPPGYEPSMLRLYLVWAAVILALYFPCRWYAGYKSRHKNYWWLSYL